MYLNMTCAEFCAYRMMQNNVFVAPLQFLKLDSLSYLKMSIFESTLSLLRNVQFSYSLLFWSIEEGLTLVNKDKHKFITQVYRHVGL
jgi:hypothetical protein